MENLYGKTLSELKQIITDGGEPSYRAGQLATWLYEKDVSGIEEMTNLSKKLREKLSSRFSIERKAPLRESESSDGTRKYLFLTEGNNHIESAWIPDRKRSTLCLSTQGGCKWGCRFCMTGTMGFLEQLSPADILNQFGSLPFRDEVSNFVFMGMGEPLDNTDNLMKSLEILTAPWGYAFSPRRITVSTVGIIPGLERFLRESECHLAYSLHNPFPAERAALMPVENKYPLREVIDVLKRNRELFRGQRRLTIEYTLIEGENDTERHCEELVRLLNGLKARVNLISYNAGTDLPWHGVSREKAEAFRDHLNSKGITATIRNSRGGDIDAACGLLSVREKDNTRGG